MASNTSNTTNTADARTICIALSTEAGRDDEQLDRAMDERGWRSIVTTEPLAAMAEAAMREREQIERSAWGLPRSESLVMLISEPWASEHADDREQLVRAMRRYLPGVALWWNHGDRITPMRVRHPADQRNAPPQRAAGFQPPRKDHHHAADANADLTITREEMDMLLETTAGGES